MHPRRTKAETVAHQAGPSAAGFFLLRSDGARQAAVSDQRRRERRQPTEREGQLRRPGVKRQPEKRAKAYAEGHAEGINAKVPRPPFGGGVLVDKRFHRDEANGAGDAANEAQQETDGQAGRQWKESGAEGVDENAEGDAPAAGLFHQERRPKGSGGGAKKIDAGVKADDFGATTGVAHPESREGRAETEAEGPTEAGQANGGQRARRSADDAGHELHLWSISIA